MLKATASRSPYIAPHNVSVPRSKASHQVQDTTLPGESVELSSPPSTNASKGMSKGVRNALVGTLLASGLSIAGSLLAAPVLTLAAVGVAAVNLAVACAPLFQGGGSSGSGSGIKQSMNLSSGQLSQHMDIGSGMQMNLSNGQLSHDIGGGMQMNLSNGQISHDMGGGMRLNSNGTISFGL